MQLLNVASNREDEPTMVMDQDIQIPVNAKVAVKSVSMNYETKNIRIAADSVVAEMKLPASSNMRQVVWISTESEVGPDTIPETYHALTWAFCRALAPSSANDYGDITGSQVGGEFRLHQDKDGHTELGYGIGMEYDPGQKNPGLLQHGLQYDAVSGRYRDNHDTTEKVFNSITSTEPLAYGFGRARVRMTYLDQTSNPSETGFTFGLSKVTSPTMIDEIAYGTFVDDKKNVFLIEDGILSASPVDTLEVDQGFEIYQNYDNVYLFKWGKDVSPTNQPQLIKTWVAPYDANQPPKRYFAMISILGWCFLNQFRFTPSPFSDTDSTVLEGDDMATLLGANDAPVRRQPTRDFRVEVSWTPNEELARLLGYRMFSNTQLTTNKKYFYTAQKRVLVPGQDLAFRVLSKDLPLSQTDGLRKTNQPILVVAANPAWLPGRLVWETQYPLFMSLQNTRPMTLRRIRFKLERLDGNDFPIQPGSIVNIVILVSP